VNNFIFRAIASGQLLVRRRAESPECESVRWSGLPHQSGAEAGTQAQVGSFRGMEFSLTALRPEHDRLADDFVQLFLGRAAAEGEASSQVFPVVQREAVKFAGDEDFGTSTPTRPSSRSEFTVSVFDESAVEFAGNMSLSPWASCP
jgi:hypothetical protein